MNNKKEKGGPQNWFEDDRNWKPHHRQRQYNNTFVNGIVLGTFGFGDFLRPIWAFSMGLQISRDFQSGDFHIRSGNGNV